MRVIIFGTGVIYQRNKDRFKNMKIMAFVDNDYRKQGTFIDGIEVLSPESIGNLEYDYIIIASKYYIDMRNQLIDMGVSPNIIIDKEHRGVFAGVRYVKKYDKVSSLCGRKSILLVSHHMGLTGAPIVLFNMAEILVRNGYRVEVYSHHEDELIYSFLQKGIPVTIFDDFNFNEEEIQYYFSAFDMVIVNTVVLCSLVSKLQKLPMNIIWWLHEESDAYVQYGVKQEYLTVNENVWVYGVGSRAIRAFQKYSKGNKIQNLLYGIPEPRKKKSIKNVPAKLVFAVIGTVCIGKAQDVFFSAIQKNWSAWKETAEFWIIGSIDVQTKKEYEDTGLIQVFGSVDHAKMSELYNDIDVVVCPSRNDTMPVVLTEGMMNKKVCIASDITGTAEYIEQYTNGLVCKTGDEDSLAECIDWVINHRELIDEIGENAYKIYKSFFSMEKFEDNVLNIVKQATEKGKINA